MIKGYSTKKRGCICNLFFKIFVAGNLILEFTFFSDSYFVKIGIVPCVCRLK